MYFSLNPREQSINLALQMLIILTTAYMYKAAIMLKLICQLKITINNSHTKDLKAVLEECEVVKSQ